MAESLAFVTIFFTIVAGVYKHTVTGVPIIGPHAYSNPAYKNSDGFFAYRSLNAREIIYPSLPVPFAHEIINERGNFDSNTGYFKCAIGGTYAFTVKLAMDKPCHSALIFTLYLDNEPRMNITLERGASYGSGSIRAWCSDREVILLSNSSNSNQMCQLVGHGSYMSGQLLNS